MLLEVRDVDVAYGRKRVLHGVSLALEAARVVALVGHNGAGKSTLLRAMMGLLPLERGEVVLDGQARRGFTSAEMIRRGVAYCPQGAEVFRTLSVEDNLELATYQLADQRRTAENRQLVFDLFPILRERRRLPAGVLSGGERQQLLIGMGLMTAPRVLLLDEPSGGLAPLIVERLFESIRRINQEHGTAILLVEQNLQQAFGVAEHVFVLRSGQLVYSGAPDQLARDATAREAILGF